MILPERQVFATAWIVLTAALVGGFLLSLAEAPGLKHYLLFVTPFLIQIPLVFFLSLIVPLEVYQEPKWKPWCLLAKVILVIGFVAAIVALLVVQMREALAFIKVNFG